MRWTADQLADALGVARPTGLSALAGLAARDIGARVIAAVDEFVGDARPHDDLSLVVLRRS